MQVLRGGILFEEGISKSVEKAGDLSFTLEERASTALVGDNV